MATNAMQAVNTATGGNTPSYSVQQGITNDHGASQIAGAANTLIGSVGAAYQQGKQEDFAKDKSTALTGLSTELTKIAQAGKTSDVDVESLQRDAVLKFQSNYGQFGVDGAKLYEEQTGRNLSGLSRAQEQEQSYLTKAQENGWGSPTDDRSTQKLQADLYYAAVRTDKQNSQRVNELNRMKQEGLATDDVIKKETLGMFKDTSKIYAKRADLLADSVVKVFQEDGDAVGALAKIKKFELELSRGVSQLGQYGEDAAVKAYIKPINEIISYAKDRINGVPQTEVDLANIKRKRAFYDAAYLEDPDRARLATSSNMTNYVPEIGVMGNVMSWVANGIGIDGAESSSVLAKTKGVKTKQMDITEFTPEQQKSVQELGKVIMNTTDQDAKMEHVLKVDSAVQFLGRNFEDFEQEDYDNLINIANETGVFENLPEESRQKWSNVMAQASVDFVTPAIDKYITNAKLSVLKKEQLNGFGVQRDHGDYGPAFGVREASSDKPLSDYVDWNYSNEGVSFTPKEGVNLTLDMRRQILQVQSNIKKTILPTLQLTAKSLQMPVAEAAKMFIPQPVQEEATEQTQSSEPEGIQFGADRVNDMRSQMLELKAALYDEQAKPNPDQTKIADLKAQLRRGPSEPVKKEISNEGATVTIGNTSDDANNGKVSLPVDLNTVEGTQTYYGDSAVEQVESIEGSLTEAQRRVVMDEGYVNGYYEDDRGVKTGGVGQTGKWLGTSFKESYKHHEKLAEEAVTGFDNLPEQLQGALVSAAYRGDLKASDDWVKLFNEGKYDDASREFLNHKEYKLRKASGGDGVTTRMERIANEIAGGK